MIIKTFTSEAWFNRAMYFDKQHEPNSYRFPEHELHPAKYEDWAMRQALWEKNHPEEESLVVYTINEVVFNWIRVAVKDVLHTAILVVIDYGQEKFTEEVFFLDRDGRYMDSYAPDYVFCDVRNSLRRLL